MRLFLIRITLILIGVILALVLGELLLKTLYPQKTLSKLQAVSFKCFEEGEHRWVKLKSNKECLLHSTSGAFEDVLVKTNSLGLRGPEIIKEKPQDLHRVLFIGDSFTMGWGVKEEEAYPKVVESILKEKAPNIKFESVNAGFTAAGPSGYYLYTKLYGLDLNPETLVIGFYIGNDISARLDVEWEKTDNNGLPLKLHSKTVYIDYNGELRFRETALKHQVPYLRNSHLFTFLMDNLFPYSPSPIFSPVIGPVSCVFKKSCPNLDSQKDEIKKLFLAIQEMASQKGIRLVVVIIPIEFQVYDSAFIEEKYGMTIPLLPSEKRYPNEFFGQFFKEFNIDYIDLLPIFEQNTHLQTYYLLDDHWNPLGQYIAAEVISDKLLEYLNNEEKK